MQLCINRFVVQSLECNDLILAGILINGFPLYKDSRMCVVQSPVRTYCNVQYCMYTVHCWLVVGKVRGIGGYSLSYGLHEQLHGLNRI